MSDVVDYENHSRKMSEWEGDPLGADGGILQSRRSSFYGKYDDDFMCVWLNVYWESFVIVYLWLCVLSLEIFMTFLWVMV